MGKKVKVDNLSAEITELLTKYSDNITEECKKVVDEISDGVMAEVKNHITFNDKDYSKWFRIKTNFEDKRNKRNTWYVLKNYQLTHLLEFGHHTRKGGVDTRKFPHVKYGDEYLKDNFFEKMKEAMEKCKI